MKISYILSVLLLLVTLHLSAQEELIEDRMPLHHGLGIELTSAFEPYSGPRLSYFQYFRNDILLKTDLQFITESSPKVRGYDVRLQGGLAMAERLVSLTTGLYYKSSTISDDIILDRLGGSFFQETDIEQRRVDYGGLLSVSLSPSIDESVMLVIENSILVGQETIRAMEPAFPSGSRVPTNQDIDDRLVFSSVDRVKTRVFFDLNVTILFLF